MAVSVNISSNLDAIAKKLNVFQREQIPYAASRALNAVAYRLSREHLAEEMDKTFQGGATSFTKRAFKYTRSNKRHLVAKVYAAAIQDEYLKYQIDGGTRMPKRRAIVVPAQQAKTNKYGNLSKNKVKTMLANPKKYFSGVPRGRSGQSSAGIWERVGGKRNSRLRMAVKYAQKATYGKRFMFERVVGKYIDGRRGFGAEFEDEIVRVLRQEGLL